MLPYTTAIVLAFLAALAASVAVYAKSRAPQAIAVGIAVLLGLCAVISVVRDSADNLMLQRDDDGSFTPLFPDP